MQQSSTLTRPLQRNQQSYWEAAGKKGEPKVQSSRPSTNEGERESGDRGETTATSNRSSISWRIRLHFLFTSCCVCSQVLLVLLFLTDAAALGVLQCQTDASHSLIHLLSPLPPLSLSTLSLSPHSPCAPPPLSPPRSSSLALFSPFPV